MGFEPGARYSGQSIEAHTKPLSYDGLLKIIKSISVGALPDVHSLHFPPQILLAQVVSSSTVIGLFSF